MGIKHHARNIANCCRAARCNTIRYRVAFIHSAIGPFNCLDHRDRAFPLLESPNPDPPYLPIQRSASQTHIRGRKGWGTASAQPEEQRNTIQSSTATTNNNLVDGGSDFFLDSVKHPPSPPYDLN
mmetsp:Transcript_17655/g.28755  ORF Transcript_17655/g.28755 Transcript_17655/m.28755 type:complete len:125 (-) Transcript_17655:1351-1725(-)